MQTCVKIVIRKPSKCWQEKSDTKTSGNIFTTTFFYKMSLLALIIFLFVFAIAYSAVNGTQLNCTDLVFLNQSAARDTMDFQQNELLKQCVRDAPKIAELK